MNVLILRAASPQTDLAHDSVHAAQRAAEKEAAKAAEEKRKAVSGRLLDAGVAKAGAKDAKATDEPPRPTLNSHVHHHNPDGARAAGGRRAGLRKKALRGAATEACSLAAYDFHVNVCANVAHKPPICANKPDAPGYQARLVGGHVSEQTGAHASHLLRRLSCPR